MIRYEINFLNVGTIKFEKNQLFLLKAFNQIKDEINLIQI